MINRLFYIQTNFNRSIIPTEFSLYKLDTFDVKWGFSSKFFFIMQSFLIKKEWGKILIFLYGTEEEKFL